MYKRQTKNGLSTNSEISSAHVALIGGGLSYADRMPHDYQQLAQHPLARQNFQTTVEGLLHETDVGLSLEQKIMARELEPVYLRDNVAEKSQQT